MIKNIVIKAKYFLHKKHVHRSNNIINVFYYSTHLYLMYFKLNRFFMRHKILWKTSIKLSLLKTTCDFSFTI